MKHYTNPCIFSFISWSDLLVFDYIENYKNGMARYIKNGKTGKKIVAPPA